MINANLLPPEVKKDIAQSKQNRMAVRYTWWAAVILLAVLATGLGGWLYFNENLGEARAELTEKAKANNSYGNLTEKAKTLADRVNAVKQIDAHTNKWPGIISEIQKVMPSGAYLTSVKIDSSASVRGSISGHAGTKQIVASLRDALENSPKFQYVDIESSKTTLDATTNKDYEDFTLSFSLEKGALK